MSQTGDPPGSCMFLAPLWSRNAIHTEAPPLLESPCARLCCAKQASQCPYCVSRCHIVCRTLPRFQRPVAAIKGSWSGQGIP